MGNFTNFNLNPLVEIISPLNQFEIRDLLNMDGQILGNVHLSITNIGLYLILSSIIFILLNILATNNNKIVSNS